MTASHLDKLHRVSGPELNDSRFMFSVHTYHMQFHMRIAELAQCPGLSTAIEKAQVLVFNWLYDNAANNNMPPVRFHSNLAEAFVPAIRSWRTPRCENISAMDLTRCSPGWPVLNMATTGASRPAADRTVSSSSLTRPSRTTSCVQRREPSSLSPGLLPLSIKRLAGFDGLRLARSCLRVPRCPTKYLLHQLNVLTARVVRGYSLTAISLKISERIKAFRSDPNEGLRS